MCLRPRACLILLSFPLIAFGGVMTYRSLLDCSYPGQKAVRDLGSQKSQHGTKLEIRVPLGPQAGMLL